MYIERLQVEEGFLSGLDIFFTAGLNVLIGARGTGKTSIIELIRFCLDSPANTLEVNKRSKEHALSILGGGQVTITMVFNGQRIIISRTAGDPAPRATGLFARPIVFSQTEIETVGLESAGRLKLIDGFLSIGQVDIAEENQAVTEVASLTAEGARVRREIESIEVQLKDSVSIDEELRKVIDLEAGVAKTSEFLQGKTSKLQEISNFLSATGVKEVNIDRSKSEVATWYHLAKNAHEVNFEGMNQVDSALIPYINNISKIKNELAEAINGIYFIWNSLESQGKDLLNQRIAAESESRNLRQEVEQLQAGAGNVMRRSQELREKKAKLNSMIDLLQLKKWSLDNVILRRGSVLDKIEKIRNLRFKSRSEVISRLNLILGPSINIKIIRNGQQSRFSALISELLRGSGIKYNDISSLLSENVSPRMLLEAVDRYDFEMISQVSGISLDRASRVLSHLRNCDLGMLGSIDIEDEIVFQLLDGFDYKDLSALSTGQRCTVILPLVLAHASKILIVDQPEDHIDNAFIANTLIKAVLGRGGEGQIIFSTHNPNIPVLGNADQVIQLVSDGRRGYVSAHGRLNDEVVVQAISNVMEGGANAFAHRAKFYEQYAR